MKWRVVALILLTMPCANAQMNTGMDKAVSTSFTGPGDVVSGAVAWWGLRAYSKSYASSNGKLANVCTPSDASCQDVPSDSSGNFNLGATSLTCNNSGSICTIKTLYDQSGNSNCAGACDITQATIANRPTLVVPGAANGCSTTSNYCALFVSGDVWINSTGLTQVQPLTASVAYENTAGAQARLLDAQSGTGFQFGAHIGANTAYLYANSSAPTVTANDSVFHALQGIFNGASSDLNVDGTSNAPLSSNPGATGMSNAVAVGGNGGNPFIGVFLEEGVWGIAFTSTNASNMCHNQRLYWGGIGGTC